MAHHRRYPNLRPPDGRIGIAPVYLRLRERTHEAIHCLRVGNEFHVSPEAYAKLQQKVPLQDPRLNPQGMLSLPGLSLYVKDYMPLWRKRKKARSAAWHRRQAERRRFADFLLQSARQSGGASQGVVRPTPNPGLILP